MVDKQIGKSAEINPLGRAKGSPKTNQNFYTQPCYFESIDKYMESKGYVIKRENAIGDK